MNLCWDYLVLFPRSLCSSLVYTTTIRTSSVSASRRRFEHSLQLSAPCLAPRSMYCWVYQSPECFLQWEKKIPLNFCIFWKPTRSLNQVVTHFAKLEILLIVMSLPTILSLSQEDKDIWYENFGEKKGHNSGTLSSVFTISVPYTSACRRDDV